MEGNLKFLIKSSMIWEEISSDSLCLAAFSESIIAQVPFPWFKQRSLS